MVVCQILDNNNNNEHFTAPKTPNQIFCLLLKHYFFLPLTTGVVGSKQEPGTNGGVSAAVKDAAGETADQGAPSASAVLGKIPATMNFEFLEMLIENILDSSSSSATQAFTLELLPDTVSAVVTFQSQQGKGHMHIRLLCIKWQISKGATYL